MKTTPQRIIEALAYRPRRSCELATAVDIATGYARELLAQMHRQGLVHVADWVKVGKVWVRVYAAGQGEDKHKPRPLMKHEIMKRYNDKWRILTRLRQRKEVTPWTGLM